jgi:uncharacterized membrane protein
MTALQIAKIYLVGVVTCFGLDLLWLGVVARGFYKTEFGSLMRPDVQWGPGILFYLVYVAALATFVAVPGVDRGSVARVAALGAFFGFAAYAAFDLTGLALLRDFPVRAAIVDLFWGATLSAVTSVAMYLVAR